MSQVVIYTDGACRGNPGVGGWGAILSYGDTVREIKGAQAETTNNQMELMAAIESLKVLKRNCEVDLYTDSVYVKDGITKWIIGWRERGWKTAAKKPVKNVELWKELDSLNAKHTVSWHWVKGHAGVPGNERADALANEAIDEQYGE
ncbi:MAG: ribonuclease HI [Saprospiraceae bacterium]|jgi:ribonuclease HI